MIKDMISFESAFGLVLGLEDLVGIKSQPVPLLHHLDIVPTLTPNRSETLRIDQSRYFTRFTASLLTFGMFGFVVYAILLY